MTTSTYTISKSKNTFLINFIVSVAITTLLFFIDEGYYNFNWTKKIWNWAFFIVYVASMLCGQYITNRFILRKYKGKDKAILTSLIGIPMAITLLFIIAYFVKPR